MKFKIGDFVLVKQTVKSDYIKNEENKLMKKVVIDKEESFCAVITGCKNLHEGQYVPGGGSYDHEGNFEPDPAYIITKKIVCLYCIRRGMLNPELYALEEDIKPLKKPFDFPKKYVMSVKQYERDKAFEPPAPVLPF